MKNTDCVRCGTKFEKTQHSKKYCSNKCYRNAKAKRNYDKKNYTLICNFCQKQFQGGRKDILNCSKKCANDYLSKLYTKFLDIPSCLEEAHRFIDKNLGYVRVYAPMHPEANTWGYVYEHRIIAEQMISRRLIKGEVVHHKNGIRWDNRPENLEVMDKAAHAALGGQRPEDKNI